MVTADKLSKINQIYSSTEVVDETLYLKLENKSGKTVRIYSRKGLYPCDQDVIESENGIKTCKCVSKRTDIDLNSPAYFFILDKKLYLLRKGKFEQLAEGIEAEEVTFTCTSARYRNGRRNWYPRLTYGVWEVVLYSNQKPVYYLAYVPAHKLPSDDGIFENSNFKEDSKKLEFKNANIDRIVKEYYISSAEKGWGNEFICRVKDTRQIIILSEASLRGEYYCDNCTKKMIRYKDDDGDEKMKEGYLLERRIAGETSDGTMVYETLFEIVGHGAQKKVFKSLDDYY